MRDINEIMPKLPKEVRWAAVTNRFHSAAEINHLIDVMPQDNRWHTIFEAPEWVNIDGVEVRKRSANSMT